MIKKYNLKQLSTFWLLAFFLSILFFIYILFNNFISNYINTSSFKDLRHESYIIQEQIKSYKKTNSERLALHAASQEFTKAYLAQNFKKVRPLVKNWELQDKNLKIRLYDLKGEELSLGEGPGLQKAPLSHRLTIEKIKSLKKGYELFTLDIEDEKLSLRSTRAFYSESGQLLSYLEETQYKSIRDLQKRVFLGTKVVIQKENKIKYAQLSQALVDKLNLALKDLKDQTYQLELDQKEYDLYRFSVSPKMDVVLLKTKLYSQVLKEFFKKYLVYFLIYLLVLFILFYFSFYRHILSPLKNMSLFVSSRGKTELDQSSYLVKEISDIKERLQESIKRSETKVEKTNLKREEDVNRLVASLAHELNNALSYLGGNLDFLSEEVEEEQPDQKELAEALQSSKNSYNRIKKIVSDLKVFSKKSKLNIQEISVQQITDRIHRDYQNIKCDSEVDAETFLKVDLDRLIQIIENLNQNALDQAEEKSLPTQMKIKISALSQELDSIALDFQDQAGGISKLDKDHIFEAFYTTKKTRGGTGLGLALSRNLARSMNGDLFLKETGGEGSTFRLLFKLTDGEGLNKNIGE